MFEIPPGPWVWALALTTTAGVLSWAIIAGLRHVPAVLKSVKSAVAGTRKSVRRFFQGIRSYSSRYITARVDLRGKAGREALSDALSDLLDDHESVLKKRIGAFRNPDCESHTYFVVQPVHVNGHWLLAIKAAPGVLEESYRQITPSGRLCRNPEHRGQMFNQATDDADPLFRIPVLRLSSEAVIIGGSAHLWPLESLPVVCDEDGGH